MLNKILEGTDKRSKIKLDKLLEKIGESPNILWYPSAGNDFHDIIEAETRTEISPDLYFHTDYYDYGQISLGSIIYDKEGHLGEIMEINYLTCIDEINYNVNPTFVDFPEKVKAKPTILLLDVLVTSSGGQIRKPVLYWYFENINFLDEVLLKFQVPISHMYKVSEGMAYGGNKKSITLSYAFLSILKTEYLLIDEREMVDFHLIKYIKDKHSLELNSFNLNRVVNNGNFVSWNNYVVNIFKVEILDEPFSDEKFTANLDIIRNLP